MASGSSSLTQASVPFASGIAIDDNNRLYVSGWSSDRVMIFPDAFTATNGPNAVNVIGQSTFSTNDFGTTQSTFHFTSSLFVDSPNKHLYVVDILNNRIMQFTASSALPVELTTFTGMAHSGSVELSWRTATETNNYGFEVERKLIPLGPPLQEGSQAAGDAGAFRKLGFIEGHGTTNAPHDYAFTDNAVAFGKYSYRLKQIDRDGKFEYSKVVESTVGITPNAMILGQNYPNPFNPESSIDFVLPVSGVTSLRVYNVLGQVVATLVNENLDGGVMHQAHFDGKSLPSGLYFYTLRSGNFVETKKMLMLK